jgi:hypothetical protein
MKNSDKNLYLNGAVAVAATAGGIRFSADFPAANSTHQVKARTRASRVSEENTVTFLQTESSTDKPSLKM